MRMKSLLLTLALAAATLAFPANSEARDWRDYHRDHDRCDDGRWDHHDRWEYSHRRVRYVDPHCPGEPPHLDRYGRLIDSRGHRVDAWGRHLCF